MEKGFLTGILDEHRNVVLVCTAIPFVLHRIECNYFWWQRIRLYWKHAKGASTDDSVSNILCRSPRRVFLSGLLSNSLQRSLSKKVEGFRSTDRNGSHLHQSALCLWAFFGGIPVVAFCNIFPRNALLMGKRTEQWNPRRSLVSCGL